MNALISFVAPLVLLAATFCVLAQDNKQPAKKVPKCMCSQVKPCADKFVGSWKSCLRECQNHFSHLGANMDGLSACIDSKERELKAAISCTQQTTGNACANSPGEVKQIPKRYLENLDLAIMAEVNRMVTNSGLAGQAQKFVKAAESTLGCMKKCMTKAAGTCDKRPLCGLELPKDDVVVQEAKKCAIDSGFNTVTVQQLCKCAEKAGVRDLKDQCEKIQIS